MKIEVESGAMVTTVLFTFDEPKEQFVRDNLSEMAKQRQDVPIMVYVAELALRAAMERMARAMEGLIKSHDRSRNRNTVIDGYLATPPEA
jgi:hypothetical protein